MPPTVQIVYISCNPETLVRDLLLEGEGREPLVRSHRIARWAAFDQFPFTGHLECGVVLHRR